MEPGLRKRESLRLTELWVREAVLVIRAVNGDVAAYAGCG
jgi:hypothetical protein